MSKYILPFNELRISDIDKVGGKNASLGEMITQLSSLGISVPDGFALTAEAYRTFLSQNKLDEYINNKLKDLKPNILQDLQSVGHDIRGKIHEAILPVKIKSDIENAYDLMIQADPDLSVAVRSSATAEDLPDASFAGQQETFLNVKGVSAILEAIKEVYASLFSDRAISYRIHSNYHHQNLAISVGIQQMARSDIGVSGVMFTLDY